MIFWRNCEWPLTPLPPAVFSSSGKYIALLGKGDNFRVFFCEVDFGQIQAQTYKTIFNEIF